MSKKQFKKVVLAYSGGLDTSAIIPWLKERSDGEIVAYVADVGQGAEELAGIEEKAKRSGATSCFIGDLREEFVREYVGLVLKSGAVYEGRYLLGTSMARPVIARGMIEHARKVGADAICHGCTGKGNDQVRFENAVYALAPDLEIIAPWREWQFEGRADLLAYVKSKGVPVTATAEKIYSRDRNLWHISHEGGALEDPWNPPPDDVWLLTKSIAEAPNQPRDVSIVWERGTPVALDGAEMSAVDIIAKLNVIAGEHGVGRIDIVENRFVGMKSRGAYETPGGTVLMEALRALEELVLDRDQRRLREELAIKVAHLVYEGKWFAPTREAIQAAVESLAQTMSGEIVVRLHKGHATAVRRKSEHSLFDDRFATFDKDTVYDQTHAEGFIRLVSLPQTIRAMKKMDRERKR